MACDLLPVSLLFHPYSGETEVFSFPCVWHLSTPYHRLAAVYNHGAAIDGDGLDLPVIRSDHQEAGFDHSQHLLLVHEFLQWVGDNEIIGPQTRQRFRVRVKES